MDGRHRLIALVATFLVVSIGVTAGHTWQDARSEVQATFTWLPRASAARAATVRTIATAAAASYPDDADEALKSALSQIEKASLERRFGESGEYVFAVKTELGPRFLGPGDAAGRLGGEPAAFHHVLERDGGVVVKVDQAEVLASVVGILALNVALGFTLSVAGALVFFRLAEPMVLKTLEGLLAATGAAVWVRDGSGRVVLANESEEA